MGKEQGGAGGMLSHRCPFHSNRVNDLSIRYRTDTYRFVSIEIKKVR